MTIKDKLRDLVNRYQIAKNKGQLQGASEATMRTWIDELLSVFGWNVQNTHQVLTEHTLGKDEKNKLQEIGSTNIRPDYTLVNGAVKLSFVDAKSLAVNIAEDKNAAFQIRSYGWSISAQFSVVTNFEQLAIYDCSVMPYVTDESFIARKYLLTVDEYVENYDILNMFLSKDNVISGNIRFVNKKGNTIDEKFAKLLGEIRKKLATAILASNKVESVSTLSFYVQTIIDRILFIRVCEARGLEEDGLLAKYTQRDFWTSFKKSSYAEFYEHYDGPMFKKIQPLQSLVVDNDVLVDFVGKLYYPSPYRFDVIPLKSLSDIYDLFLGYQLVVKDGNVYDELKSEFKKSNGAVTTPESLVNRVVCSTLPDSFLSNLSVDELLKFKIADIACGSGVFLAGIYDKLALCLENKIANGDNVCSNFYANIDGKIKLTISGRKAIINNCIYGVDINPEAVEVAKLSLSLKIIDNYNPKDFNTVGILGSQILKGIGTNIKCGNSLVGSDIYTVYPNLLKNIAENQMTNAFDWMESYPEVFNKGGFDCIVGNPPYVEVKNYNVDLPTMASYIKYKYSSSKNGKIDLAIPFIEKSIELLNENGRLGFIIQKRFFKDQYGKGIRRMLTQEGKFLLNGIYDYEENDLFSGRTTYVAIVVCDKNVRNNDYVWYMNSVHAEKNQLMPAKMLNDSPWNFETYKLNCLRTRLGEDLGTLQDVCNIRVGVQVLWNDAYQIVADKISDGFIKGHSKIDDDIVIEYDACKPLLCNEQFAPLTKRDYKTFAVFPYDVTDEGEVKDLSFSEFTALYPKAGAYLEKHKDLICSTVQTLPEKNKSYNLEEHWHLFTRANNHGAIYPKVCVPMTAQYPQASVVLDYHVYCDNANMFFIQVENASRKQLYALAAIMNSTIFNTLARSLANPQRGGYYKFNRQFLDPVPFPCKAFVEGKRNIVKLAETAQQIEQTNEQIRGVVGGQTSGLELTLRTLRKQLDDLCLKLYGIKKTDDKAVLYSVTRKDRNPYGQEN